MKLQVTKAGCAIAIACLVAACGGGGDGEPADAPQNPGPGGNAPPTIQGQPGGSVVAGQAYNFRPTASDPNNDTLTFTATNVPGWATFNQTTGAVTGTPSSADVGTYSNISISASDGSASTTLAAFSITVTDIGTGAATLSWTPPTQNSDGSSLTNLAGFRITYGRSADVLDRTISVTNPSVNSYVVESLSSGTWYFAVAAVNGEGVSSATTNVASKTI